ncbi:MAG: WGR domain-containing protein [Bacteroidales bacterium]|jgi:predicted DNA-binding WGR domain protein|nr:WGR domain-containing protein [Bacteroidales bacterium]
MRNWKQLTAPIPNIELPAWFIRSSKDQKVYVFSLLRDTLYKYNAGTFTVVYDNLDIYDSYITACECYWDTNTDCLTIAIIKGYSNSAVELYRLQDGKFNKIELESGDTSSASDCLVWDSNLNQLVHVKRMKGEYEQAVGARLLNGVIWHNAQIKEHFNTQYLSAGFDEYRKMVVVVDADGRCAGLDGQDWIDLPKHPTGSCSPSHFITSPTSGRLTMMHRERTTSQKTIMYELDETKWNKINTGDIVLGDGLDCNHGLIFPNDGHSMFIRCHFASNRLNYQFTKFDGTEITPYGPIIPPSSGFLTAQGRVFTHGMISAFSDDWSIAMAEFINGKWVEVPVFDKGVMGVCIDADNTLLLQRDGSVYTLQEENWAEISKGDVEFIPRIGAAVAWDSHDKCMYVTSGEPLSRGRFLTDLFKFSAKEGWVKLSPKGKKPAFRESIMEWDRERKRLVLVGGKQKSYKENENVYEWDGKSWKNYSTSYFISDIGSLTFDPKIGKIIACSLWDVAVYHGEGRFETILQLNRAGELSYDASSQTLFCLNDGLSSMYIGDILSDLPEFKPKTKTDKTTKDTIKEETEPNRYLRFTEDGADKFWIAERKDNSYELHWGKRGTKGQRRSYSCDTEEKAIKEFNKKVLAKIDKGYWDAPEGKDASVLPGKKTYHWILGGKGNDFVGGKLPQQATPTCSCGEEMIHVITTDVVDHLKLNKSVSAYMCPNPDGDCETWEAFSDANRVILNSEYSKDIKKRWLEDGSEDNDVEYELIPNTLSYTEKFETDPTSEDAEDLDIHDKCGGYPTWYQGNQTPVCPECNKKMTFVAQFSEFDEELNLGGDGVAYIFVCEDEHEGAILWQCG